MSAGLPWFAVRKCMRCATTGLLYEPLDQDGTYDFVPCPVCRGEGFTQENVDAGPSGVEEGAGS